MKIKKLNGTWDKLSQATSFIKQVFLVYLNDSYVNKIFRYLLSFTGKKVYKMLGSKNFIFKLRLVRFDVVHREWGRVYLLRLSCTVEMNSGRLRARIKRRVQKMSIQSDDHSD